MNNDSGEGACGEEQGWAPVIPHRDPAPVLEAREDVLDLVAQAIECGIVWDLNCAAEL